MKTSKNPYKQDVSTLLKDQIADILNMSIRFLEEGGQLFAKEMPGIIKELVWYCRISHLVKSMCVLVGLLSPILTWLASCKICAVCIQFNWPDGMHYVLATIFITALVVLTFVVIIYLPYQSVNKLIKAVVAPRLTVLEQLRKELRGPYED